MVIRIQVSSDYKFMYEYQFVAYLKMLVMHVRLQFI